jgi:hypothetical protein
MENLSSNNPFSGQNNFSFPSNLPLIGAGLGCLVGVAYYLGIMFTQLFVGRPPSTWIIGIFWLPFLTYKHALVGLFLGCFAWCLVKIFHRPQQVSKTVRKRLWFLVVSLMFVSATLGGYKIVAMAKGFAPRVAYTSNEIVKLEKSPFESALIIHPSQLWEMSEKSSEQYIAWNGREVTAYGIDDSLVITDKTQVLKRIKLGTDDDEIRYIPRLYGFSVRFEKSVEEHLVLVVQVRAINDCSMLIILDPQGQLVYQEILRRIVRPTESVRKMKDQNNGREVLIIGDKRTVIYGSKP